MAKRRGAGAVVAILAMVTASPPLAARALEPVPASSSSRQDAARSAGLLDATDRNPVRNLGVAANWVGEERFWYRKETADGAVFVAVDASTRAREPAFDHQRVAEALARASDRSVSPDALPFRTFQYDQDGASIGFEAFGAGWRCSLAGPSCVAAPVRFGPGQAVGPDGRSAVFRRDHNLWIVAADGHERALTTDGVRYDEYGHVSGNSQVYVALEDGPATAPGVSWSPDSRVILTHRIDETRVGTTTLWQGAPPDGSLRPKIHTLKQSYPGDADAPVTTYVLFDAASGRRVDVTGIPDGLVVDPIGRLGNTGPWMAAWTPDSAIVYALARDRHFRRATLLRIDAASGEARPVLEETSPTFVSLSGSYGGGLGVTSRLIDQGRQLLWFSERDGWGHLYRYDLATGALLNRVTSGPWVVTQIVDVDERRGVIFFLGAGREEGRNPYLNALYRVNLDGTGFARLTPEDGDHVVSVAPGGRYVVDSYSRVDTVPVSVLRSAETGEILMTLEEADAAELPQGWRWPIPFVVKARDGETDLFGTMHLPSTFDPAKTYPVIDHVYPGAHFILPDVQAFSAASFFRQALAELGFIVVNLDGLGTPGRGKAFHDLSYGNLQDGPGLPDHVAGLRDLARTHPQMDLDRVGVLGHSSGGYGVILGMLRYPEFYKVGVASAPAVNMCGAVRVVMDKWQGPDAPCDVITLANMAPNLRGKLLLAYGDMDEHVPPATMIQFVDALTRADRDYDLLVMPNRAHGFSNDPYFRRRMADYFVRHLLSAEPRQKDKRDE